MSWGELVAAVSVDGIRTSGGERRLLLHPHDERLKGMEVQVDAEGARKPASIYYVARQPLILTVYDHDPATDIAVGTDLEALTRIIKLILEDNPVAWVAAHAATQR